MSDIPPFIEHFDPEEPGPLREEEVLALQLYIQENAGEIRPGFKFTELQQYLLDNLDRIKPGSKFQVRDLSDISIFFDINNEACVLPDKPMGGGQYGSVYLLESVNFLRPGKAGQRLALKVQDKEGDTATAEMALSKRAKSALWSMDTGRAVLIAMPLEKVTLKAFINPESDHNYRSFGVDFTKKDKVNFAISALDDLHRRFHDPGLIHRDLNASNIMIDPVTKKARIIDPGLAIDLDREKLRGTEDQKALQSHPAVVARIEYFKGAPFHLNLKAKSFNIFVSESGQEFYIPSNKSVDGAASILSPEISAHPFAIEEEQQEPLYPRYSAQSDVYALGKVFKELGLDSDKELRDLIQAMMHEDPAKRPSAEMALAKLYQYRNKEWHDAIVPTSEERLNNIKKDLKVFGDLKEFVVPKPTGAVIFSGLAAPGASKVKSELEAQKKLIPREVQQKYAELIRLEKEFANLNRIHREDKEVATQLKDLRTKLLESNPYLKRAVTADVTIGWAELPKQSLASKATESSTSSVPLQDSKEITESKLKMLAVYLKNFESDFEKNVIAASGRDYFTKKGRDYFEKLNFQSDLSRIKQAFEPIIVKLSQGGKDLRVDELNNLDKLLSEFQGKDNVKNDKGAQKYLNWFRKEILSETIKDLTQTVPPPSLKGSTPKL